MSAETYHEMGGTENGAAFVTKSDTNIMIVNAGNANAWNAGNTIAEWVVGHESLHSKGVELIDQRGSNGEKAYMDGTAGQRASFNELKGTDKGYINPDNLMNLVY